MMQTVTDIEKLREIAIDQHGYVTTSQAEESGVSRPSLTYLVKNDRIDRIFRGIYRIPQIPATPHDTMHLALLWTDAEKAVLSHDTALDAWGVSDVNPTQIHATVPKGHRINKAGGKNVIVHHQNITESQVGWWEQMPITKLSLTIEQCIDRGLQSYLIRQAIKNGRSRGMLSKDEADCLINRLDSRNEKQ